MWYSPSWIWKGYEVMFGKKSKSSTKKPSGAMKKLKQAGMLYGTSGANLIDMMDIADMVIRLGMKTGGKPDSKYRGCSSSQTQGYGKVLKNKSNKG